MTQAASSEVKPVIKFLNDYSDIRVCYKSSRAVSTIQKMPNGKYQVVKVYEGEITECKKYSEAKQEAESAAMLPAPQQAPQDNSDLVVCYRGGRAVSTIQKQPSGRWMVVKLYEDRATAHTEFSAAEEVATSAAMKHAPRTKKDAA